MLLVLSLWMLLNSEHDQILPLINKNAYWKFLDTQNGVKNIFFTEESFWGWSQFSSAALVQSNIWHKKS